MLLQTWVFLVGGLLLYALSQVLCAPYFAFASSEKTVPPLSYSYFKASNSAEEGTQFLLLHGLTSSKETWADTAALLTDFGSVIAVDLPGYGASYDYLSSLSRENIVTVLSQFVKSLGMTRPIVIGHSMGAKVAVLLSEKVPYSALIIEDMEMEPRTIPAEIENCKQASEGFSSQAELIKFLLDCDYRQDTIDSLAQTGKFIIKNGRFYSQTSPGADFAYITHITSYDGIREKFKGMAKRQPLLLLRAAVNSSVSDAGVAFMKSVSSRLTVKAIPQSKHSIHKSNRSQFLHETAEFLQANKLIN